jgi:hypothetical protein
VLCLQWLASSISLWFSREESQSSTGILLNFSNELKQLEGPAAMDTHRVFCFCNAHGV